MQTLSYDLFVYKFYDLFDSYLNFINYLPGGKKRKNLSGQRRFFFLFFLSVQLIVVYWMVSKLVSLKKVSSILIRGPYSCNFLQKLENNSKNFIFFFLYRWLTFFFYFVFPTLGDRHWFTFCYFCNAVCVCKIWLFWCEDNLVIELIKSRVSVIFTLFFNNILKVDRKNY